MAIGFMDLKKAFDAVPREEVMASVRWVGVPEAQARIVETRHERTKGGVLVGRGLADNFQVDIGLNQGTALSPLLFIMVMELLSRKINTKDV